MLCRTLGTEILLLDDVAASLRVMAAHAVVYDDAILLWLADQVERVADQVAGARRRGSRDCAS